MKFQATAVLDFDASSIAEAGQRLNELLEHAQTAGGMKIRSVQLGTAPKPEPVALPNPAPRTEDRPTPTPPRWPPHYSPPTAHRVAARTGF